MNRDESLYRIYRCALVFLEAQATFSALPINELPEGEESIDLINKLANKRDDANDELMEAVHEHSRNFPAD